MTLTMALKSRTQDAVSVYMGRHGIFLSPDPLIHFVAAISMFDRSRLPHERDVGAMFRS